MSRPERLHARRRLTCLVRLAFAIAAAHSVVDASRLHAQTRQLVYPVQWRLSAELAGSIGGTWLEGPRSPTVSSGLGYMVGVGVQRGIGEFASGGAMLRGGAHTLEVSQPGERWKGGRLVEVDAVAMLSLQSRTKSRYRLALDLGAGAAVLGGASDLLPFQDATSLSPLAEIGASVRRGAADLDGARRDLAFFVRYGALRVDALSANAAITNGWVGRIATGLRISR